MKTMLSIGLMLLWWDKCLHTKLCWWWVGIRKGMNSVQWKREEEISPAWGMTSGFFSSVTLDVSVGGGMASCRMVGGTLGEWAVAMSSWCWWVPDRPHWPRRWSKRCLRITPMRTTTRHRPASTPSTTANIGCMLVSSENWPWVGDGFIAAEGNRDNRR